MRSVRNGRILAALALAVSASGCLAWRVETVPAAEVVRRPNVSAVRIAKSDRSKIELWDPHLAGDSVVGHPTERAIARVSVPLGQITTIETRHKSLSKTLLVTLVVAGSVAVYGLLQTLNSGY